MSEQGAVSGRDLAALLVPRAGEVRGTSDPALPWMVADETGQPVGPASEFLKHLLASGNSVASCRSYSYDLLRWYRFLAAVDVRWDRAQRSEVRDFVLWLRLAHNPARDRRRPGAPAPGEVNARTGKPSLRAGYAPATINHAVAVLAAFYGYHAGTGRGPAVSPVPPPSRDGRRVDAHHNPLEPFRQHRRGAYRQKQPDRPPRAVPDEVLDDLFARLECHRDRALFHIFLASGARAAEMLAMTVSDARPGDGRIFVQTQGPGRSQAGVPVLAGRILLAGAVSERAGRRARPPAGAG